LVGWCCGGGVVPRAVWCSDHPEAPVVAVGFVGGLFIIWRHKGNIDRLRAGTENVFTFGKKKTA